MGSKYENSFKIISEAGDARSKALNAIKEIEKFNFEAGEKLIKESKKSLQNAHQIQTDLIRQEINGDEVSTDILMVHGQDHFVMATVAIDMAETMLHLYKTLNQYERRMEK